MQKCKIRILILLCFMLMAAGCACSKESEDILVSTSSKKVLNRKLITLIQRYRYIYAER